MCILVANSMLIGGQFTLLRARQARTIMLHYAKSDIPGKDPSSVHRQ
jgi:hypothetical protein